MKKAKKGFTLIELIAVMAIMGIVGITINTVFSSTINLNNNLKDKLIVQENITLVQRSMHNDIRKAKKITDVSSDSFKGSDMDKYCGGKKYKPILYLESITGTKTFYAYDEKNKQVKKITILNSTYQDNLLGEFIDSIIVNKNGTGEIISKDYYDVKLYLTKKNAAKQFQFRVSTVDYGGDI